MTTPGCHSVSNVPAQTVIFLNSDFTHQQSVHWAERLIAQRSDADFLIAIAFQEAFNRDTSAGATAAVRSF